MIDVYYTHDKHTHTRIRVPFINKDGLYFRIYRSGLLTPLGRMVDADDPGLRL